MPKIYDHQNQNTIVLNYASARISEIQDQIRQLQAEHHMYDSIIKRFQDTVCSSCSGQGIIMRPIPGCECDGPRQHTCGICGGTGQRCGKESS